jgi:hypothetical protein
LALSADGGLIGCVHTFRRFVSLCSLLFVFEANKVVYKCLHTLANAVIVNERGIAENLKLFCYDAVISDAN